VVVPKGISSKAFHTFCRTPALPPPARTRIRGACHWHIASPDAAHPPVCGVVLGFGVELGGTGGTQVKAQQPAFLIHQAANFWNGESIRFQYFFMAASFRLLP